MRSVTYSSAEAPSNIYFDDPKYAAPTTNDHECKRSRRTSGDIPVPSDVFFDDQKYAAPNIDNPAPPESSKTSADDRVPPSIIFDDLKYAAPFIGNSTPPPASNTLRDDRPPLPPPEGKASGGGAPKDSTQPPLEYSYVRIPISSPQRHEYYYLECPATPTESGE